MFLLLGCPRGKKAKKVKLADTLPFVAGVEVVDRGYSPDGGCVSATDHVDHACVGETGHAAHVTCSSDHVICFSGHATSDAHVSAIEISF